jgi:GGDEF domain-containing protein
VPAKRSPNPFRGYQKPCRSRRVGIGLNNKQALPAETIIRVADKAMYEAKAADGNRVVIRDA